MIISDELKDIAQLSKDLTSESQKKPDSKKKSKSASVTTYASYSGPIPPPNFLVEYERMVPGIAKRLLNEPRLEAEHRRAIEKMMADNQLKLAKRGQKMAFTLASLCVIGAFGTIFLGYSFEGLGALLVSIAVFAGIFYNAKKKQ